MAETPAARPDLAALVAHYRDLLGLRDWAITARWDDAGELPPTVLARISPTPERKLALILVAPTCPAKELRSTIAHELVHALISPLAQVGEWSGAAVMLEEQAVEALALAITRAEQLPAEAAVMRRALADIPSRLRARLVARSPNTRSRMDAAQVLEAIKAQDGAAALSLLDAYLVDLLKGAAKDAGIPDEDVAPVEGEAPPEMARRMLRKVLARKAIQGDALGPKVLARLGATSESAALMRIEAGESALGDVARLRKEKADREAAEEGREMVALVRTRHAAGTLTRAQAFTSESIALSDAALARRDAGDKAGPEPTALLVAKPVWLSGKLEDLRRTLDALGTPHAPARRIEPEEVLVDDTAIPPHVEAYCRSRGITDPKKKERMAALLKEQNR